MEQIEDRKERAERLLDMGAVHATADPNVFRVQSETDPAVWYTVNLAAAQVCNCEDFYYNGLGTCKHRLACEMHRYEQEALAQARAERISLRRYIGDRTTELFTSDHTAYPLLLLEAAERLLARRERVREAAA